MVGSILKSIALAACFAVTVTSTPATPTNTTTPTTSPASGGLGNLSLCQLPHDELSKAAETYPELKIAIETVLKQGIVSVYKDDLSKQEHDELLNAIKTNCRDEETALITVYGLPNKDCVESSPWSSLNHDAAMYSKWLQDLVDAVGTKNVIYIYEPDALSLTIDSKCGITLGYIDLMRTGISILTQNPNALLYVDVGYWTLMYPTFIPQIIDSFKKIEDAGRIKGISVGTSNYRPTSELTDECATFAKGMGTNKYHCVLDTSRNYLDTVPGTDWCNQMWAGVGHPATGLTGNPQIDALLWIKPVGESDGTCNGGPSAGSFWYEGFATWWNQGWFVKNEKAKTLPTKPSGTAPPQPSSGSSTGGSASHGSSSSDCDFSWSSNGSDSKHSTSSSGSISNDTPEPDTPEPETPTPHPTPSNNGAVKWGQCGGNGWNGLTTCNEGRCVKLNDYYSQCQ